MHQFHTEEKPVCKICSETFENRNQQRLHNKTLSKKSNKEKMLSKSVAPLAPVMNLVAVESVPLSTDLVPVEPLLPVTNPVMLEPLSTGTNLVPGTSVASDPSSNYSSTPTNTADCGSSFFLTIPNSSSESPTIVQTLPPQVTMLKFSEY